MKKILALLLCAFPLLLSACNKTEPSEAEPVKNVSSLSVQTKTDFKQKFYDYLEKGSDVPSDGQIITVGFILTEAHTFGYDYYIVEVYYAVGTLHKIEFLIAVNGNEIVQTARINN